MHFPVLVFQIFKIPYMEPEIMNALLREMSQQVTLCTWPFKIRRQCPDCTSQILNELSAELDTANSSLENNEMLPDVCDSPIISSMLNPLATPFNIEFGNTKDCGTTLKEIRVQNVENIVIAHVVVVLFSLKCVFTNCHCATRAYKPIILHILLFYDILFLNIKTIYYKMLAI